MRRVQGETGENDATGCKRRYSPGAAFSRQQTLLLAHSFGGGADGDVTSIDKSTAPAWRSDANVVSTQGPDGLLQANASPRTNNRKPSPLCQFNMVLPGKKASTARQCTAWEQTGMQLGEEQGRPTTEAAAPQHGTQAVAHPSRR